MQAIEKSEADSIRRKEGGRIGWREMEVKPPLH